MVLYSRYRAYVYSGVAALLGACAVWFFISAATSEGFNTIPLIITGIITLLLAAIPVRIARLRVVLREDHLELVNLLRTHRILWPDVDRIDTFVLAGWKVRIWTNGVARVAFGLSQYNKYRFGFDPKHDTFDRDAPAWIRRGYTALQQYWQAHKP